MSLPDLDAVLADFLDDPSQVVHIPALMRLGRRLPAVGQALDPLLEDPLDRALLGLGPAPEESALDRAVLSAVSVTDGGGRVDAEAAAALEERARGHATWWPLAAQVHAASSAARETRARMALSVQELPYVFPGELHPVVVDLLAAGARIVPALHVDWARKLTRLAAGALVLDCRALGLWFWPVLRSLPTERTVRPVMKLAKARRIPPGGRGLAAAYAFRVGASPQALLDQASPLDLVLAALGVIGDRPA